MAIFLNFKTLPQIFAYKINSRLFSGQIKQLASILSDSELKKFYKFHKKKDAEVFLVSRFLLRKIISSFANVSPDQIIFTSNKFGRPRLKHPTIKYFDFNLSHSGDWIAVAISDSRVGIDIEKIRPIDIKLATGYFSEPEIEYLNKQPNHNRKIEKFYKVWVLKESFIKAIGKGLSYPLKNFYFKFGKFGKIAINLKGKNNQWFFKSYDIDKNYKLAICLEREIERVKIVNIKKLRWK